MMDTPLTFSVRNSIFPRGGADFLKMGVSIVSCVLFFSSFSFCCGRSPLFLRVATSTSLGWSLCHRVGTFVQPARVSCMIWQELNHAFWGRWRNAWALGHVLVSHAGTRVMHIYSPFHLLRDHHSPRYWFPGLEIGRFGVWNHNSDGLKGGAAGRYQMGKMVLFMEDAEKLISTISVSWGRGRDPGRWTAGP